MKFRTLPLSMLVPLLMANSACTRAPSATGADAPPPTVRTAGTDQPGDTANDLARGEYLVRITGCNDCHTPGYAESAGEVPTSQWLTGSSLGWNGPWGTTYPANLRLKLQDMDEAGWLTYSASLHARPPMPDLAVRTMNADDRRAIYRFIHSLGVAGQPAPAYLPPGTTPPPPYVQWVLPPAAPAGAKSG